MQQLTICIETSIYAVYDIHAVFGFKDITEFFFQICFIKISCIFVIKMVTKLPYWSSCNFDYYGYAA